MSAELNWDEEPIIGAAKRLGMQQPMWMGDDWFTSWSPRNDNANAEGYWCHWVHLARLILADRRTQDEVPDMYLPYDDEPEHVYDDHLRGCARFVEDGAA